jgi:2-polyprenyl-3-methyl-5-hydroxy-6-metoxy-1,4-benzoquinol methylase
MPLTTDTYQTERKEITPAYIRDECNAIYSNEKFSYNKHYSASPYFKVWNELMQHINQGESVVDIGCGVGQLMEMMLDNGIGKYLGFDISPVAIAKACERLSKRKDQDKASLVCTNIFDWEDVPEADIYILAEILEHITNDKDLLKKIPSCKRVLITVPSFLGGSHVRKFDTCVDVYQRYKDMIPVAELSEILHGSGKIFIMSGIKI